jgi:hypothetical protein
MCLRSAVVIALISLASVATAGIYRWTDANGKVHFGDRPPPQVERQQVEVESSPGWRGFDIQLTYSNGFSTAAAAGEPLPQLDAERIEDDVKAPLNNSAQLCASAAGVQNKAAMAGNGQPFSTLPTTLLRPAARALRGTPENSSSVSPIFAVALLERQTGFVTWRPLAIQSGYRIIQRCPQEILKALIAPSSTKPATLFWPPSPSACLPG